MTTPREPADRYPEQPTARIPERHVDADRVDQPAVPAADRADVRHDVVEHQREQFGGVKIGSAFFGWLTAVGTGVLLTALVATAGAALGLGVLEDPEAAADEAAENAETIGWAGAIALLIILFIAYWCGGYVAGRMARFNGIRQGVAVWLWAVVIAIIVAVVSLLAGARFDILLDVNTFPRIPLSEGDLTVVGIITAILVAVASLAGAIIGGLAGTRYHRRVDRAGLVDVPDRR